MITALQLIQLLTGALNSRHVDELDVIVEACALPTGAAISANQTTMITALQSIQNLVGALNDVGLDEIRTIAYPHGIWGVPGVTQVQEDAVGDNSFTILYAVPTGKTFYLTNVHVSTENASGGSAGGYLYIRTGIPAEVVRWQVDSFNDTQRHMCLPFNPPIEMPEDYDIVIRSDTANYHIHVTIHGYTI